MTPEELADLAHLRRARDLIDREYARPLGSFSERFHPAGGGDADGLPGIGETQEALAP